MVKVGFCGYNLTETDKYVIRRDNGNGDYLFLLLMTPFFIYSGAGGGTVTTEPNACILFPPGKPHHYQSVQAFKNSFIHFTSDYDFISKNNIPVGTVIYPKHPDAINLILKNIVIETINKPLYFEQKIDCLANELFIDVAREFHDTYYPVQDMSLYSQFQKIRLTLIARCEADWTTESMCKLAHMEKSQFYNYYVSFFKTTPKADIINARIEKAKNLLTNQELKVNQVSEMCGFKNVSHFTRCFKKRNKYTPRNFAERSIDEFFI